MTSLFGLDASTVQSLADKGLWGIIALLMIVVGRFWIIPSITKFLESRTSMGDKVLNKLDILIENFDESNKEHQRIKTIEEKVDILLGEHAGTLDARLAMHTFATIINKQHLMALSFFNIRIKANGLHTHRDIIIGRYHRKAEEVANKTICELQNYYHQAFPLSHFFTDNAKSYYSHFFNALFNIQTESIHGTNPDLSLEDLQAAMDRNVSRLMGAFKKWLTDKNNTYKVAQQSTNFELMQESSAFEELY